MSAPALREDRHSVRPAVTGQGQVTVWGWGGEQVTLPGLGASSLASPSPRCSGLRSSAPSLVVVSSFLGPRATPPGPGRAHEARRWLK